jgi:ribosomal protein S18 acetylase RimI-like enzyme
MTTLPAPARCSNGSRSASAGQHVRRTLARLGWDYVLAKSMWPETAPLSLEDGYQTRQEKFTYCAVVEDPAIHAMAAVWKCCDAAWEVVAVSTKPATRRRGYGKAVVTLVTAYILEAGRLATCSTASDNIAIQRTAVAVGFYPVRRTSGHEPKP